MQNKKLTASRARDAHRVAWLIVMGSEPVGQIDHITLTAWADQ